MQRLLSNENSDPTRNTTRINTQIISQFNGSYKKNPPLGAGLKHSLSNSSISNNFGEAPENGGLFTQQ